MSAKGGWGPLRVALTAAMGCAVSCSSSNGDHLGGSDASMRDGAARSSNADSGSADGALSSGDSGSADGAPCAPGASSCHGGCVDEQTATNNCGACGHDCLGGTCTAGKCQPVVIASGQLSPNMVRVDGENVYWVNEGGAAAVASGQWNGQVMKCPKNGCGGGPSLLWSGTSSIGGLGVNAVSLYWPTGAGQVMTCPVGGCTRAAGDVLFSGPSGPYGMAVTATNAYWTDANGYIVQCAVGGCGSVATNVSGQNTANELAVDGTRVYWTSSGGGQVLSCPVAGCAGSPSLLASNQATPKSLVVDATNIYWVNLGPPAGVGDLQVPYFTEGQIMECPLSGCNGSPTVLAAVSPYWLGAIAVDATTVYWTSAAYTSTSPTSPNGQIMACSIGGCAGTPSVIASTDTIPQFATTATEPSPGLAVDDTRVFWSDTTAGTILALAK